MSLVECHCRPTLRPREKSLCGVKAGRSRSQPGPAEPDRHNRGPAPSAQPLRPHPGRFQPRRARTAIYAMKPLSAMAENSQIRPPLTQASSRMVGSHPPPTRGVLGTPGPAKGSRRESLRVDPLSGPENPSTGWLVMISGISWRG